ncbi:transcriptional regulator [Cohnella xylanilytica]|uniref:MerR family transcriptional regulator n=1 Tax=Cohnella xylanilytica TaxID=557555 RepID=A0A841U5B8_9BACL|nr:MerR family transcriptional regulator [Cohnella xylanilytica]MBB6694278.1 MerR family transcriptional regulator [Cohnella xylanilytica]GIO13587.1 transcriptional regulator [Cohnella xylanilytica]
MSEPTQADNVLMDFDLLKKLVVGIGEVADISGVPQRQIRYWEDKGIIRSVKEGEGSTRKYDYLNIKKVLLVKELLDDGFTLDAAARKVEERMKTINDAFSRLSGNKGQSE